VDHAQKSGITILNANTTYVNLYPVDTCAQNMNYGKTVSLCASYQIQ